MVDLAQYPSVTLSGEFPIIGKIPFLKASEHLKLSRILDPENFFD
jgi:hypothetical protein